MTTWRDKVIVIVRISTNRVSLSICISYAGILIWTSILSILRKLFSIVIETLFKRLVACYFPKWFYTGNVLFRISVIHMCQVRPRRFHARYAVVGSCTPCHMQWSTRTDKIMYVHFSRNPQFSR